MSDFRVSVKLLSNDSTNGLMHNGTTIQKHEAKSNDKNQNCQSTQLVFSSHNEKSQGNNMAPVNGL